LRFVEVEGAADGLPQTLAGALCCVTQHRLEFGEGLLDRVDVSAVGRQVDQPGAGRGDRLGNSGRLMAAQRRRPFVVVLDFGKRGLEASLIGGARRSTCRA
jgi:hypothetical protein